MEGKGELLLIRLQADVQNSDLCNVQRGRGTRTVRYFGSALRTTRSGTPPTLPYLTDT